jgi:hypothetical protein
MIALLVSFNVEAGTKTVHIVAKHSVAGKKQIPPEARLTVTAYDGDNQCGVSSDASPPRFLVNFPIYVEEQTKRVRVETTLVGADDYVPREPSFTFPVTTPKTDLGTRFIVNKPTAFLINADKAEKAANTTSPLPPAKLENALLQADTAVTLANSPETELRSKRAKAALQVNASADPQQKIEAVETLRSIDLPEGKKGKLSLLQQRFDTYEIAAKSLGALPDERGFVSQSLNQSVTDEASRKKLNDELGTLVSECKEIWPYEKVSFDDKLMEYKKALGSDVLAAENIVRVTLDRRGQFKIRSE